MIGYACIHEIICNKRDSEINNLTFCLVIGYTCVHETICKMSDSEINNLKKYVAKLNPGYINKTKDKYMKNV